MVHMDLPCTHIYTSALVRSCLQRAEIHSNWHIQIGFSLQNTIVNHTASRYKKSSSTGIQQDENGVSEKCPSHLPWQLHSLSHLLLCSLTLGCLSSSLSFFFQLCFSAVPGPAWLLLPLLDVSFCPYLCHCPNNASPSFSHPCHTQKMIIVCLNGIKRQGSLLPDTKDQSRRINMAPSLNYLQHTGWGALTSLNLSLYPISKFSGESMIGDRSSVYTSNSHLWPDTRTHGTDLPPGSPLWGWR